MIESYDYVQYVKVLDADDDLVEGLSYKEDILKKMVESRANVCDNHIGGGVSPAHVFFTFMFIILAIIITTKL